MTPTVTISVPKLAFTLGKAIKLTVASNVAQSVTVTVKRAGASKVLYKAQVKLVAGKNTVTIPAKISAKLRTPGIYRVTIGTKVVKIKLRAARR